MPGIHDVCEDAGAHTAETTSPSRRKVTNPTCISEGHGGDGVQGRPTRDIYMWFSGALVPQNRSMGTVLDGMGDILVLHLPPSGVRYMGCFVSGCTTKRVKRGTSRSRSDV